VAGAEIFISRSERVDDDSFRKAESDRKGRFKASTIAPGTRVIRASKPAAGAVEVTMEITPGRNDIELQLVRGPSVWVQVTDPAGDPSTASPRISVHRLSGTWSEVAETDRQGQAQVALPEPGHYRFALVGWDFLPTFEEVEIPLSDRGEAVILVADPGSIVEGRILGVSPKDEGRLSISARHRKLGQREGDVTEGRYRVSALEPGTWEIVAEAFFDPTGPSGRVTVDIGQGEKVKTVDLTLEEPEEGASKGFILTGSVKIGEEPAGGIIISVFGKVFREALADLRGRFRVDDLPGGQYKLQINRMSAGLDYQQALEMTADRELHLRLEVGSITGVVTDRTGQPLGDASLRLIPVKLLGRQGVASRYRLLGEDASIAPDGTFHFPEVLTGRYRLFARLPGYAALAKDLEVRGGEYSEVQLRLEDESGALLHLSTVRGTVPSKVWIQLRGESGLQAFQSFSYRVPEDGTLVLKDLPPGRWILGASAEGLALVTTSIDIPGGEKRLLLPEACELSVSVPDLASELAGGHITLTGRDGRRLPLYAGFGHSLDRGFAKLDYLPPGTWTVTVTAGDDRRWSGSVETKPGAPAHLILE